jgi:hypothetical protein
VGYIFLSYSRKDKGIAEQLENRLKAAGYEMWIDIEGIRGGDLWREAIVKAIDQADALLVLLSPNSVKSDNVCTELVLATENKTRIVPVDISTPRISIPSEMRYLLAGKQRVKYPSEFEKLLEALGSGSVKVEAQQAVSARDESIPAVAAPPGPPPPLAAPVSKQGSLPWLGIGLAAVALMIAVGAIGLLVGQSSNGGTQGGTGTVVAKASPTTVTPTDTPGDTPTGTTTATAIPTGTPTPTDTPTVTPTATPRFAPTEYKAGDYFEDIWRKLDPDKIRLGYPKDREIRSDFAVQKFEKGVMYWWDNPDGPDYIWVLVASTQVLLDGTYWERYDDTWKGGGDKYSCDAARPDGPIEGFGKVWCDHRSEWPTDLGPGKPQRGSSGNSAFYGRVQFFQGGVMLYNRLDAEVYVLFDQIDQIHQKEWKLSK